MHIPHKPEEDAIDTAADADGYKRMWHTRCQGAIKRAKGVTRDRMEQQLALFETYEINRVDVEFDPDRYPPDDYPTVIDLQELQKDVEQFTDAEKAEAHRILEEAFAAGTISDDMRKQFLRILSPLMK